MAYESVDELNRRTLLELVHGLNDLREENAAYVEAFLGRGSGEINLERYKEIIRCALHWDPMDESEVDFGAAANAWEAYSSASNDHIGLIELMIYGITQGNEITLGFGDMGADFYEPLEEWYQAACVGISNLGHEYDISEFIKNMAEIRDSTSGLGWGYHDGLCDLYAEHLEDL